jgi:hypothetical protein
MIADPGLKEPLPGSGNLDGPSFPDYTKYPRQYPFVKKFRKVWKDGLNMQAVNPG